MCQIDNLIICLFFSFNEHKPMSKFPELYPNVRLGAHSDNKRFSANDCDSSKNRIGTINTKSNSDLQSQTQPPLHLQPLTHPNVPSVKRFSGDLKVINGFSYLPQETIRNKEEINKRTFIISILKTNI